MQKHGSLNHIYRLVWSQAAGSWVAVAETAKGKGKRHRRKLTAAVLALSCMTSLLGPALAGPTGAHVVSGAATINHSGVATTINQSSQNTTIDWSSFNIGKNESVTFRQPNATSVAINRILGNAGSSILGQLNANGEVFLINPNGILFGPTAQVNVGALVASALSGSGTSFTGTGTVTNQGSINATQFAVLLGSSVINQGSISTAPLGTIILGAGNDATLTLGNHLNLKINKSTLQNLVSNTGLVQADGGTVILTAGAKNELFASVVNNTGLLEARSVGSHNGTISLLADMGNGQVNVGGTLDASAPNGGTGGLITTDAANVVIAPTIKVTTLAAQGQSGTWVIDPTDFTITADNSPLSISGIGNQTLMTALANTSVNIATSPNGLDHGDINVNGPVSWSNGSALTLSAINNINVNQPISVTGSGKLHMQYGQGAVNLNNTSLLNIFAPINLSNNAGFTTLLGSDGPAIQYTVINTVGNQADATSAPATASLQGIAASSNLNNPNANFVLGSNIDASATALWNSGAGFTPVGSFSGANVNNFMGVFNGLGHTISGLTINLPNQNYVALFAAVIPPSSAFQESSISNVGLINANVIGNGYVGGLVSVLNGVLSNSYVNGKITGYRSLVGGLVADNAGTINDSYATATVTAKNSYFVGGLVGSNDFGTINNSYASGAVHGLYDVGGLAGLNLGTINQTYSSGSVTGSFSVGGLTGLDSTGSANNSYWDINTSGQSSDGSGAFGLSTADMHNAGKYIHFNFSTAGSALSGNHWVMVNLDGTLNGSNGGTYPMLASEYSTSINNAHQLQLMALAPNANYTLVNNIDASNTGMPGSDVWNSAGFIPVGQSASTSFNSVFNGQNFSIANLTINSHSSNDVGLFGYISASSLIENLTLNSPNITGINDVGALAGYSAGNIMNSNVIGTLVSGHGDVGGLVGNNTGAINGSSATGTVYGTSSNVGGLVGVDVGGSISNSDAIESVTGFGHVGGLLGSGTGSSINHSHAGDFGVTNVTVNGNVGNINTIDSGTVGGLVGYLSGNILNSYATVPVTGLDAVGGLVGFLSDGSISTSFATGNVNASLDAAGGLVGVNGGAISKSYATNSVSSRGTAGGLVGVNYGTIDEAYAAGTLSGGGPLGGLVGIGTGAISNSFWDTTTSNMTFDPSTTGVTGMTTGAMQIQNNFINATSYNGNTAPGWDFTSTWFMYDTHTYPLLQPFAQSLTITAANVTTAFNNSPVTLPTTLSYTIGNLPSGSLPGTDIAGTLTQTGPGNQPQVHAGNYSSTLGGLWSDQMGYMIHYVNGTLTIKPETIVVSTTPVSKVYDGTPGAIGSLLLVSGTLYNGDNLAGGSFAFSDSNVGTKKTVNVSGGTVISANPGDYVVAPQASVGLSSITAINLSVSGETASWKFYDGTNNAALSGKLSGTIISGDVVNLVEIGKFSSPNASTCQIFPTVGCSKIAVTGADYLTGNGSQNYTLTQTANLSSFIVPLPVWASGQVQNKVADGTTKATVINATLTPVSFCVATICQTETTLPQSFAPLETAVFPSAKANTYNMPINVKLTGIAGITASNYFLLDPIFLSVASIINPVKRVAMIAESAGTPESLLNIDSLVLVPIQANLEADNKQNKPHPAMPGLQVINGGVRLPELAENSKT